MRNSKLANKCVVWFAVLWAGLSIGAAAQPAAAKGAAPKPATAAAAEPSTQAKVPKPGPFHGKLAAVDPAAQTISVGKRTFQITAQTKMRKAGQGATLADAVVGEIVSGYVKPDENGKLLATTVNFGPKTPPVEAPQPAAKSK